MDRTEFLEQKIESRRQKYLAAHIDFYASPAIAAAEPFKIADRLYHVGDKKVCVHLIETDEGLVLLDAGFPCAVHLLVENIWRAGFDPRDVRWILHSHGHFDHIGASEDFRKLYGTKLAISKAEAQALRDYPVRAMIDWGSRPFFQIPTFDRELEDGEIFEFGGVKIRCVLTPGHSAGVMSFFFEVTDSGQSYLAGMFGGAGITSLTTDYMFHQECPMDNPEKMFRSLDQLMDEPVTVHLGNHPYNNDTFGKRERQLREGGNPFIDDGSSWRTFLAETRAKCEKIVAGNTEMEKEMKALGISQGV